MFTRKTILILPNKSCYNVFDLEDIFWCTKGFPRTTIAVLPCKKKRNQEEELSGEEKEYNRIHAKEKEYSDREHAISVD
jgi:hypothetical protein